jgi:hypothetical protein
MSFTVAIVVPPVPAEEKAAWAALDEALQKRRQGPRSPVFQELHDQLTARYPCPLSLPPDQKDEDVWTDGPLIGCFENGAAVLGIRPARVDEVLPFLIRTANALGLAVFDEQNGKIHRPTKQRKKGAAKGSKAKPNSKRTGK